MELLLFFMLFCNLLAKGNDGRIEFSYSFMAPIVSTGSEASEFGFSNGFVLSNSSSSRFFFRPALRIAFGSMYWSFTDPINEKDYAGKRTEHSVQLGFSVGANMKKSKLSLNCFYGNVLFDRNQISKEHSPIATIYLSEQFDIGNRNIFLRFYYPSLNIHNRSFGIGFTGLSVGWRIKYTNDNTT